MCAYACPLSWCFLLDGVDQSYRAIRVLEALEDKSFVFPVLVHHMCFLYTSLNNKKNKKKKQIESNRSKNNRIDVRNNTKQKVSEDVDIHRCV